MTVSSLLKQNVDYKYVKKGKLGGLFGGDKLLLTKMFYVQTGITGHYYRDKKVELNPEGMLYIKANFIWDGASGFTIDTPATIRASLVHDALYQLIKAGADIPRKKADRLLYKIMRQDGASRIRARCWLIAVRLFGWIHC